MIRRGELEFSKFGRADPPKWIARRTSRIDRRATEEVQLDAVVRIVVFHRGILDADLNLETGFFKTFPRGRGFGRFAGLHLATWEFPKTGQRNIRRPPADQEPALMLDDGDGDLGSRHLSLAPTPHSLLFISSSNRPGEPMML
jgi:hypothetical protein